MISFINQYYSTIYLSCVLLGNPSPLLVNVLCEWSLYCFYCVSFQLPKAALWYKYVSIVLPYFFPTSESEANSERFADASPSRKESVARAQNLLSSHTSLELRLIID